MGESPATLNRSIRPSTPADSAAIVALFAEVGLQPDIDPEHLSWKYWHPRADWPGPRSFVLTSGSKVVAHGALIPGALRWGSQRLSIIHMIDWAARRGEVGAGMAVLKHISQQAGALLATGGSAETLRILPHLGFRTVGRLTGYVRVLRSLRPLRGAGDLDLKVLPRLVRSAYWALSAPSARSPLWETFPIAADDLDRIASVLPAPTGEAAVLERSAAQFRYMLACPVVRMALFGVARSGRTLGYFLLAYVPGQVRIVDCWMDSREPDDWRAMVLCAVEEARRAPHAAEAVIWASDAFLSQTLETCGFHARHELAIQLRHPATTPMPTTSLRVQMLDSDAAFLHGRRNEYWA